MLSSLLNFNETASRQTRRLDGCDGISAHQNVELFVYAQFHAEPSVRPARNLRFQHFSCVHARHTNLGSLLQAVQAIELRVDIQIPAEQIVPAGNKEQATGKENQASKHEGEVRGSVRAGHHRSCKKSCLTTG